MAHMLARLGSLGGATMDTGQKTESIVQLVDDINRGAVALPEFQRDFVWDIEKTYDLFDSFARDIFVGSLIYGIPSFEITVRELDRRARSGILGTYLPLCPIMVRRPRPDFEVNRTLEWQCPLSLSGMTGLGMSGRFSPGLDACFDLRPVERIGPLAAPS
jgi:hypothetical protein